MEAVSVLYDNLGTIMAYIGVALAVALAGCGSAKGVGYVGEAMAGVIVEDPRKFGQLILLQALPGTQGIYGFVMGLIVMVQTGMINGTVGQLPLGAGFSIFAACLPVGIVGLVSGPAQGRVSAAGVHIVAKRPEETSKAMIAAAMVETYAILALLVSLLMFLFLSY